MKLAYVTSQFPCGPNEAFLSAEVLMLAELGVELIITPVRPRSKNVQQETAGMSVLALPSFGLATFALAAAQFASNPAGVLKVLGRIAGTRYRLSSKIKNLALFPKALALARALRRKQIDHVHAHWLSMPSTVAYVVATLLNVPWSCTAHRFDLFEDNLIDLKASDAKFIRAISERTRSIVGQKSAAANGHCRVLHLGVVVPPRYSVPMPHEKLRIVCVSHLVPVKGHRVLLRAVSNLRKRGVPVECDLVGNGPLRRELEDEARSMRLNGAVRFRGYVDHDRLCAELLRGEYDVAVLASTESGNTFEGVPVALMEAMAAGVPCVATRTGSIPELINDRSVSRLVPQQDAGAMSAELEALFLDRELRAELGKAARARIIDSFDARKTARELYDLISA